MSLKKDLSGIVVKELYQAMSSEHFARLSTVFWRLMNEWQRSRVAPGAGLEALLTRIEGLEQKAVRLQTKLEALEEMIGRARG